MCGKTSKPQEPWESGTLWCTVVVPLNWPVLDFFHSRLLLVDYPTGLFSGDQARSWFKIGFKDKISLHRTASPLGNIFNSMPILLYTSPIKQVQIYCRGPRWKSPMTLADWRPSIFTEILNQLIQWKNQCNSSRSLCDAALLQISTSPGAHTLVRPIIVRCCSTSN